MKVLRALAVLASMGACSDASFNDAPRAVQDQEVAELPPPAPEAEAEPVLDEETLPTEISSLNAELKAEVEEADLLSAEYASQIPGVSTVKVGVNFEDTSTLSDLDYNDAVLCFQGYFKVDQAKVVSAINQTIVATTSSISGCSHTVEVIITHANGTSEAPITYNSRLMGPLNLSFKTGDSLNVSLSAIEAKCDAGVKRSMSDPNFAKVLIGVCNTTGI